jgi:hypothetical protein
MRSQESDGIAGYLANRVETGADSAQLAEVIAATCRAIDHALAPIIGPRGVAALYRRSVHLASQTYPWLAKAHQGAPVTLELAPLSAVLARQTSTEAVAAGALLLQTFRDVLTTLVGPSLAERLLRSVWATFLSGPPAQDTTP